MSAHKLPCTARVTFTQCKGFSEAFFVAVVEAAVLFAFPPPVEGFPLPMDGGGGGGAPEPFDADGGGGPGNAPQLDA